MNNDGYQDHICEQENISYSPLEDYVKKLSDRLDLALQRIDRLERQIGLLPPDSMSQYLSQIDD